MALSDDIKERLDIVEVVGSYAPALQKSGRNFKVVCPFHSERTASFVVFPDRQTWRCFGACATGGDAISFVMRVEKLGFMDTLRLLAQQVGISISQHQEPRERKETNPIYQVNKAAAVFFQEVLQSNQGVAARAYLTQRGVNAEMAKKFELGLSPGSGSALMEYLSAMGYSSERVLRAGLATAFPDALPRDMFRGRLMFPIRDDRGRLAGFGGRSLDRSDPKYLNSPSTEVFDKGKILYAFHLAKDHVREEGDGVVVEGYMDAITAHQYGFGNVVASMGTALTEAQVALLRGIGRRFVLAMDPDTAGQEATFRSLETSWQSFERRVIGRRRHIAIYERASDVSLKIAVLPPGRDPDKVIREDPASWRRLMTEALPLLDYLLTSAQDRWDITTSDGKARAAEQLSPLIAALDNPFEQERYFRQLADALGVQLATLEASLGRPQHLASLRSGGVPMTSASANVFEGERLAPVEEHLLALLLRWPELREYVRDLESQALERWEDREVFTCWIECSTIDQLLERLEEDLRQRVNYLLSLPIPPMDVYQREQAVKDCSHRLEERRLRNLKAEEALLLDEEGQPDAVDGMEELEQRVIDTNERLRRLFQSRPGYQRHD